MAKEKNEGWSLGKKVVLVVVCVVLVIVVVWLTAINLRVSAIEKAAVAVEADEPMAMEVANPITVPAVEEAVVEKTTTDVFSETSPTGCRPNIWFDEALSDTNDVANLIATLDRDFTLDDGGQWSEPGYTVPARSTFWTDLFENVNNLPNGVSVVRVQGGWGIYYTTVKYVTPKPNGGGRWMRLCDPLSLDVLAKVPRVEKPAISPKAPSVVCEIPDLSNMTVAEAINTMDDWFEDVGYQHGNSFAAGDTIPAASVFWANMGEGFERSECLKALVAEGNWGVFQTSQSLVSPSAGRYVVCNS